MHGRNKKELLWERRWDQGKKKGGTWRKTQKKKNIEGEIKRKGEGKEATRVGVGGGGGKMELCSTWENKRKGGLEKRKMRERGSEEERVEPGENGEMVTYYPRDCAKFRDGEYGG